MFTCIILLISTFFTGGSTLTEEPFQFNRAALELVFLTSTHYLGWNKEWNETIMINHCARYYRANKPFLQIDENEKVYSAPGFEPRCSFQFINREVSNPIIFPEYTMVNPKKVDILGCKCAWENTVNATLVNPDDGYFYLSEIEIPKSVIDNQKEYYNHWKYFEMEPKTLPDHSQVYTIKKCWAIAPKE